MHLEQEAGVNICYVSFISDSFPSYLEAYVGLHWLYKMILFKLSGMLVMVQSYLLLLMKQNILSSTMGGHFNAVFTLAIISVRPDVVSSKFAFHT